MKSDGALRQGFGIRTGKSRIKPLWRGRIVAAAPNWRNRRKILILLMRFHYGINRHGLFPQMRQSRGGSLPESRRNHSRMVEISRP
jgi:hypothetical protein